MYGLQKLKCMAIDRSIYERNQLKSIPSNQQWVCKIVKNTEYRQVNNENLVCLFQPCKTADRYSTCTVHGFLGHNHSVNHCRLLTDSHMGCLSVFLLSECKNCSKRLTDLKYIKLHCTKKIKSSQFNMKNLDQKSLKFPPGI